LRRPELLRRGGQRPRMRHGDEVSEVIYAH
jgi:hypothetical protein